MSDRMFDMILAQMRDNKNEASMRFDKLEEKVDELRLFKWKIAGGAIVASAVMTFVFQAAIQYLKYN